MTAPLSSIRSDGPGGCGRLCPGRDARTLLRRIFDDDAAVPSLSLRFRLDVGRPLQRCMDYEPLVGTHRGELDIVLETSRTLGHHEGFGLQVFDLFGAVIVHVYEKHRGPLGRLTFDGYGHPVLIDFFDQVVYRVDRVTVDADEGAGVV